VAAVIAKLKSFQCFAVIPLQRARPSPILSRSSQLSVLVLLEPTQFFQVDIVWFSRLVQPPRFISTNSFLRNVFDVVNLRLGLQVSFRCSEFGELVLCEIVDGKMRFRFYPCQTSGLFFLVPAVCYKAVTKVDKFVEILV